MLIFGRRVCDWGPGRWNGYSEHLLAYATPGLCSVRRPVDRFFFYLLTGGWGADGEARRST